MKNSWIGATLAAIALLRVRPASAQIGIVSVTGGRVEGVKVESLKAMGLLGFEPRTKGL
jgi:hypothetical protein